MRTLFFMLSLLLFCFSGTAFCKAVYVDTDDPVYKSREHDFSLSLPPGQWGGTLSSDKSEVRFSDGSEGEKEITEVLVRALPRKGLSLQACMDEEMKGYREISDKKMEGDRFSFRATAFDESHVFIKYFFRGDKVLLLAVKSSPSQKPSFDYTAAHVEKTFRPSLKKAK